MLLLVVAMLGVWIWSLVDQARFYRGSQSVHSDCAADSTPTLLGKRAVFWTFFGLQLVASVVLACQVTFELGGAPTGLGAEGQPNSGNLQVFPFALRVLIVVVLVLNLAAPVVLIGWYAVAAVGVNVFAALLSDFARWRGACW
jgi:hypothetical protein